ncbi:Alpha-alpha-trehalose-phosphate synthase [Striga hermonthica]|uniref:Alpha-alpha-trehalose-phosphate synthase n=1 Tax=Striga hermonthica TaxID=68872 RepID=A0A9N7RDK8_STRHE|nr:Alpha-alpha-trehalose-phosphate synthase [Striga hermonthica]
MSLAAGHVGGNGRNGDHDDSQDIEQSSEVSTVDGLRESPHGRPIRQRLLVVANRLPVSALRREADSWSVEISAGGLEFEIHWIGWPGVKVADEAGQMELTKALAEKNCVPVFLKEESAYKSVNRMFVDVVWKHYEDGDIVWCQDYHLIFVPKFLKEYDTTVKVGWFLHTPFPSSEVHPTRPSRTEVLHAILAADLVGFQTDDYATHFVHACTRILGVEVVPEGVEDQGRTIHVAVFPLGIDAEKFIHSLEVPRVQEMMDKFKAVFAGRKVMMGVDRLDTSGRIPQKILGFEKFLEENPGWQDKVVLLQVALPTTTADYQKLKSQVNEIVVRVNCRFGTRKSIFYRMWHLSRPCATG